MLDVMVDDLKVTHIIKVIERPKKSKNVPRIDGKKREKEAKNFVLAILNEGEDILKSYFGERMARTIDSKLISETLKYRYVRRSERMPLLLIHIEEDRVVYPYHFTVKENSTDVAFVLDLAELKSKLEEINYEVER